MNAQPSSPRRVMIDARYIRAKSSGIGRYTQNMIRELLELEPTLELELITHPSRPAPFADAGERVRHHVFNAAPNSIRTRATLGRLINRCDVDLYHSPFNFLPANLNAPAVFTLHDIMWLLDPSYCTDSRILRALQGRFYGHVIPRSVAEATRVMTVSEHSKDEIERYFPGIQGRVHVTHNGLDPFFHVRPEHEVWAQISEFIQPRKRFALIVGQGSPYKNHRGALMGFLEAFRDDPSVYLVLVRRFKSGLGDELADLLRDPALGSRLICLDYVTGEQLRALYNAATCFLFPSYYEGFGLPPLEAMACGTPVVASNIGAPFEVCGPAGLCVDPHDPKAIGGALRRVFDDPRLHAQLRERGLEHARRFTWRRCAEAVLETYKLAR